MHLSLKKLFHCYGYWLYQFLITYSQVNKWLNPNNSPNPISCCNRMSNYQFPWAWNLNACVNLQHNSANFRYYIMISKSLNSDPQIMTWNTQTNRSSVSSTDGTFYFFSERWRSYLKLLFLRLHQRSTTEGLYLESGGKAPENINESSCYVWWSYSSSFSINWDLKTPDEATDSSAMPSFFVWLPTRGRLNINPVPVETTCLPSETCGANFEFRVKVGQDSVYLRLSGRTNLCGRENHSYATTKKKIQFLPDHGHHFKEWTLL